jgi:hypothetical protein
MKGFVPLPLCEHSFLRNTEIKINKKIKKRKVLILGIVGIRQAFGGFFHANKLPD